MASTTKVSNYLLTPGTNRGRHPATMGSSWSCNMYLERNQENAYLESVPGLEFYRKFTGRAKCRGSYVSSIGLASKAQQENCFAVFGTRVFRLDSTGEFEEIGTVNPGAGRVTFAESGGLRPFLLIADGNDLWAYNLLEGGRLSRISLPPRVIGETTRQIAPSHVCCVAGSIVVNDVGTGQAYYTVPYPLNQATRSVFDIVDGEVQYEEDNPLKVKTVEKDSFDYMFLDSYGRQQYLTAETAADNLKAVTAVGPNLYLFGSKTVEIWQRGSGEYETWQRQSYTTNASNGIQAPYSVATCGSDLYYLGCGESFAKGVLMVSGQSYSKISETWLDEKLLHETGDSAFGFAYAQGNHHFYVLQLDNLQETWVYDAETKEWHQRVSRVLSSGREIRWRPSVIAWFQGKFIAFCNDGCGYIHSDEYWYEDYMSHDERLPMIRHRQGAVIVDEERPFIFNELAIECNVGCWSDYTLQPDLLLECSRDGGNTWGHVRSCKMGRTGDYSHRVRFHNLGYQRLCVLRVTYSHPTSLELTACSQRVSATTGVI